jgi:hypothetical protein
MPTPASGTISIQQINAEFGRGNNLNAYRGTTWFTPQGGSGTFPSGAIAMSDFYNKQPNSPTFSFTISSNQTNANLRTLAVNAGWNQSSQVVATIAGGIYISSNSTGVPGLTVNGSFPSGVQLINNGFIVGMGGAGGAGRSMSGNVYAGQLAGFGGAAGSSGGLAMSVSVPLSVTNNGTIGGGGGGGGGGEASSTADGKGNPSSSSAGGGGGGGRSSAAANSAAGAAGTSSGNQAGNYQGSAGGAGTVSSAGGGGAGAIGPSGQRAGGNGGGGGGWGAAGSTGGGRGANTISYGGPFSGGSAGGAVSGNGNITWLAFGTRLGAIT